MKALSGDGGEREGSLVEKNCCNWKVVHIGGILEVVYVEFVVLGSIGIGVLVGLDVVHTVVDMVGIGYGHMELNGGVRHVSMVYGYIEE